MSLALWSRYSLYVTKGLMHTARSLSLSQVFTRMRPTYPAINRVSPAAQPQDDEFLTAFDQEVLASMGRFTNRPGELFRIASPALLSLALCPATLYLYIPLVGIFWPTETYATPPNINEAIACFLAPAGLVYATSFGFAFQQALYKQREILQKVSHELGLLDQIATLTTKLSLPSLNHRMQVRQS